MKSRTLKRTVEWLTMLGLLVTGFFVILATQQVLWGFVVLAGGTFLLGCVMILQVTLFHLLRAMPTSVTDQEEDANSR